MYFYVDESGNTGTNLFDVSQPWFYYGVLSSKLNCDTTLVEDVSRLRAKLGVARLHAAELGYIKLALIADELIKIQNEHGFLFDIYRVAKFDHALIVFFDEVFDQGLNPAVSWGTYWTPLRYYLLLQVSRLFDEELAKRAWAARIEQDNNKSAKELACICSILRERVPSLKDKRAEEVIENALKWAENNPQKIGYNRQSKEELLGITPNVIGFQAVIHGIGSRLVEQGMDCSQIIVDQQSQFNKSQHSLQEFYVRAKDAILENGPGMPKIDFSATPTTPLKFSSSSDSIGLELVDIYIWIMKRFMEDKEISLELVALIKRLAQTGNTDEISLESIARRWSKWFNSLPEPNSEMKKKAMELMALDEKRRIEAIERVGK